jgi:signal transduction histidine kinase
VAVLTAGRLALIDHASWAQVVGENEATNAILGLTFGLLGALAVANRPRNALSWLFVAEGQANALAVLGARWVAYAENGRPDTPLVGLAAWVGAYIWIPGFLLATVILPLIYPTGEWQSRAWRTVGRAALIFTVVALLVVVTSNEPIRDYPGHSNPLGVFPWSDSTAPLLAIVAGTIVFAGVGLVALIMRFRGGTTTVRAQVGWLFLALLFNIAVAALPTELPGLVGAAFLAVALGLAVVRYGLYDIERLFTRTVVYGALIFGIVAVFALFAGLLGSRINDNALGAVLAAVVVALGIGPARERLQQLVDRLMYGQRSNPYAALTGISQHLDQASSDTGALSAVAAAIADTLRLPYVAITLRAASVGRASSAKPPSGASAPAATVGVLEYESVELPLLHGGTEVGQLTVGLRRGERRLSSRDATLLADIARLAAAAAHEVTLAADLRRSRERLIVAREEERRRLRRDLHDGLGPALAGMALGMAAAGRAAERGDPNAAGMLSGLQHDVEGLLSDVRRISHDLRPAALDELGLVDALRQRAEAITDASNGHPLVRVDADGIPALPAAVEVAAYRIVSEALSNAVRHAGASLCTVRLSADGLLHVEVWDDGRGLPDKISRGVGLDSMTERAAELGGSCVIESSDSGTRVRAELPLTVGP